MRPWASRAGPLPLLLHSTPVMPDHAATMAEQRRDSDEPRLDTDETREALPIPEAAERLGLTIDAVRMRIRRGTLQSVDLNGKKHVLAPRLDTDATRRDTDATPPEQTSPDAEALVGLVSLVEELRSEVERLRRARDDEGDARLQGELGEVRARLADAQADRDRWHASATAAIERYNHDMQEMRGLLGREQVIALSATTAAAAGDAPQEHAVATERDDQPVRGSEPAWRRWLRRLGGD